MGLGTEKSRADLLARDQFFWPRACRGSMSCRLAALVATHEWRCLGPALTSYFSTIVSLMLLLFNQMHPLLMKRGRTVPRVDGIADGFAQTGLLPTSPTVISVLALDQRPGVCLPHRSRMCRRETADTILMAQKIAIVAALSQPLANSSQNFHLARTKQNACGPRAALGRSSGAMHTKTLAWDAALLALCPSSAAST